MLNAAEEAFAVISRRPARVINRYGARSRRQLGRTGTGRPRATAGKPGRGCCTSRWSTTSSSWSPSAAWSPATCCRPTPSWPSQRRRQPDHRAPRARRAGAGRQGPPPSGPGHLPGPAADRDRAGQGRQPARPPWPRASEPAQAEQPRHPGAGDRRGLPSRGRGPGPADPRPTPRSGSCGGSGMIDGQPGGRSRPRSSRWRWRPSSTGWSAGWTDPCTTCWPPSTGWWTSTRSSTWRWSCRPRRSARLLSIPPRTQVVRIRGLSMDKAGTPFDCFEQLYPARRVRVRHLRQHVPAPAAHARVPGLGPAVPARARGRPRPAAARRRTGPGSPPRQRG